MSEREGGRESESEGEREGKNEVNESMFSHRMR